MVCIAVVAGAVLAEVVAALVLIVVLAAVRDDDDLPCSVLAVDLTGLDDEDVDDDLL